MTVSCTSWHEQSRTSARVIANKRHPELLTGARYAARKSFSAFLAINAPRGGCAPGIGRIRADFHRYLSRGSPTARPTRAVIQHIPGFQNLGFLVRRDPCEL
jgi:hypothetical protein